MQTFCSWHVCSWRNLRFQARRWWQWGLFAGYGASCNDAYDVTFECRQAIQSCSLPALAYRKLQKGRILYFSSRISRCESDSFQTQSVFAIIWFIFNCPPIPMNLHKWYLIWAHILQTIIWKIALSKNATRTHYLTFTHLAEVFKNANKFRNIDIIPLKRGHLISFHNCSSESKWISKMYLHDVPHGKYDKTLVRQKFLISRVLFFSFEVLQNSFPANPLKSRIWNLERIVTTKVEFRRVCLAD